MSPRDGLCDGAVWELLRAEGLRARLLAAVQVVEELSPFGAEDPVSEQVKLVKRYATVRPFLPLFSSVPEPPSTDTSTLSVNHRSATGQTPLPR